MLIFILHLCTFPRYFLFILNRAVKNMEPSFQMSQPGGATGSTSLCVDYFRSVFITTYMSIRNRHWTILCTSMVLITDTMVPIQLLPLILGKDKGRVIMVPIYKYTLQGVLLFESVLIGILAIILHRRRSGVLRNPDYASLVKFTSISSLPNSIYHVFEKLRIDDEVCDDELKRKLGPLRFKLQAQSLGGEDPQSNIVLNEEDLPLLQKDSIKPVPPATKSSSQIKKTRWIEGPCWVSKATMFRKRWIWKDNYPWLFQKVPLCVIHSFLSAYLLCSLGSHFGRGTQVFL